MATIQHANISDPNIHEPKGVADANENTVYIADGEGSGRWDKITPGLIQATGDEDQELVTDGLGGVKVVKRALRISVATGIQTPIPAQTTALRTFAVAGLVGSTDMVVAVTKPRHQQGLLIGQGFIVSDGVLSVQLVNITNQAITPFANDQYEALIWRTS
jgi:hypothetical protein